MLEITGHQQVDDKNYSVFMTDVTKGNAVSGTCVAVHQNGPTESVRKSAFDYAYRLMGMERIEQSFDRIGDHLEECDLGYEQVVSSGKSVADIVEAMNRDDVDALTTKLITELHSASADIDAMDALCNQTRPAEDQI